MQLLLHKDHFDIVINGLDLKYYWLNSLFWTKNSEIEMIIWIGVLFFQVKKKHFNVHQTNIYVITLDAVLAWNVCVMELWIVPTRPTRAGIVCSVSLPFGTLKPLKSVPVMGYSRKNKDGAGGHLKKIMGGGTVG